MALTALMSMNVTLTLMGVFTIAPILLAGLNVSAMMDISYKQMVEAVWTEMNVCLLLVICVNRHV